MKKINSIFLFAALLLCSFTFAQKVTYQGKDYKIKGDKIFIGKEDITASLSVQEQSNIKSHLQKNLDLAKAEKQRKKAEKKQKKTEKEHKKAENAIKKQKKAVDNLAKSKKKLEKESMKFDKLKAKGKLSPEDEIKWLKKLEKLQAKIGKAQKKVN